MYSLLNPLLFCPFKISCVTAAAVYHNSYLLCSGGYELTKSYSVRILFSIVSKLLVSRYKAVISHASFDFHSRTLAGLVGIVEHQDFLLEYEGFFIRASCI